MLTAFAIVTDGLVYAAYLFLVAVGLTLIFGVMKILNVTHGSFYAFGAYGAAIAVGVYFDRGFPAAGGFLLMIVVAMAIGLVLGVGNEMPSNAAITSSVVGRLPPFFAWAFSHAVFRPNSDCAKS